MSIYHDGFLHTNSSYFGGADFFSEGTETFKAMFRVDSIMQDYKEAYDYAKAREVAFYQKFFPGVTDYETFIMKVREVFNEADRAGEKIRRLSNASLKKDYIIKNKSEPVDYKITVTKDALERMSINLKTEDFIFESDTLYLSIDRTADIGIMKEVINYIKSIPKDKEENFTPFAREHLYNTTKFSSSSLDTKALARWLSIELDKENDIFEKEIIKGVNISTTPTDNGNSSTTETFSERIDAKTLPFSKYSATEINAALASGDKEMKKAANQAVNDVHDFLLRRLEITNGDTRLKKAFDLAWNKVDKDFFFEGDNIIKGVLGNPNEFALDITLNYIALASKEFSGKLGQIIGDIVQKGRGQGRSDYEIDIMVSLGADIGRNETIGIQSKNVDQTGYSEIEVNTDLGLMLPNLGDNIVTSIANYKFNASIASKVGNMSGFLKNYLEKYIWRGLNFNVKDELDPGNTNTFYFLGGDKLIPVSDIIYRLYNNRKLEDEYKADKLMKKPETVIKGLTRGKDTDASFEVGNPPKFTRYWHGNEDIGWTPDHENHDFFEDLLRGIRVNSTLNFASFLQVSGGTYEMFR